MNQYLQHYIRQSFPEHSELTVSEIFAIKHIETKFMNNICQLYDSSFVKDIIIIKDLFYIDLKEFFEQHKEKYIHDFINENCFELSFHFSNEKLGFNYNLYNMVSNSATLFVNNIKNDQFTLCYNNETVKYNKINFHNIMFKFIDFIKKTNLRSETIFSFFQGYLIFKTDITDFFEFYSSMFNDTKKITISEYSYRCPSLKSNNKDKYVNIYHKRHHLYISNQDSNILLKKDLRLVAKSDFYNEIIKPFKDILIQFDDSNKVDFSNTWEKDAHNHLSTIVDKKHLDSVKIKINIPELKSEFLDKIIYSQRPVIELFFILNNEVVSYLKIDSNYDNHNKDIIEAYQSYKELAEVNSQKIELQNLINPEKLKNNKKRI